MLNKVILISRLTRDPELRYTPNGHPVAGFTLAVDGPFRGQNGEKRTDFIVVVTWRKVAEQVTQFLGKGRMVAVEGGSRSAVTTTATACAGRLPRSWPILWSSLALSRRSMRPGAVRK